MRTARTAAMIRCFLLFPLALVLAITAGWCTLQSNQARTEEGIHMHQALQLTAMTWMELQEQQAVTSQELQVASNMHYAQQASHQYTHQSVVDLAQQNRSKVRGAKMSDLARQEIDEADRLWALVEETDQARLQLVQQIAAEQTAQQELETSRSIARNDQFHTGACSWHGVHYLCTLVAGATQLPPEQQQQQVHAVDVQIHRDMQLLVNTSRREFLQAYVAQALQTAGTESEQSAQDYFQEAHVWQARAQHDALQAVAWNQTAQELAQADASLQARLVAYASARQRLSVTTDLLLKQARVEQVSSQRYSVVSLALAAVALAFFVYRAVPQLVQRVDATVQDLIRGEESSNHLLGVSETIWRSTSYGVLHVVIFLAAAAWCSDYVGHLNQYDAEKRAVVVWYFALMAAATQSALLHTISHWNAKRPWTTAQSRTDLGWTIALIVKYFCLRLLCLMPLFAMELLFVWLSPLRSWALNPAWRQTFLTHILLAVLLTVHLAYFLDEPNPKGYSNRGSYRSDDQSTVNLADEESHLLAGTLAGTSEQTPVREGTKTTNSRTATDILPFLYRNAALAENAKYTVETSSHYSLNSESPHHVSVWQELIKLILPFEMLAAFLMILIINVGLENLLGTHYHSVHVWLAILSVSGLVSFILQVGWCRSYCSPRHLALAHWDDDAPPKVLYI